MEDGCKASLCKSGISHSVKVGPLPETMIGNARVWDFRNCKRTVIPEGIERIGNSWFYGSDVESVEIPMSIKYIDANAFCNCQSLERVLFAEDSLLERIGERCFCESGVAEIRIPSNVIIIEDHAFDGCKKLKRVTITEGSKL